ncbi:glycosyltransferase family 2 protein [Clostridium botulinum]|uniref:Glycosyl transferase, group 2 family n=1 Tax=Clostridium botulinum (strain Langeland / NCTC 10281 / Type F) TaxID=441772 RepID=A7GE61_CLOBL|nr:glycosyltransferase family 2 protein [Clostridium botulinum]ABS42885.1 glycosyl transferase, group 2 family [Clostridium botulinum F str. Langeland]ADF99496.1 glycosyl transferase, group 2 family [Clostridium botulinum F str. 230613]KKM42932.1 glycosyl transferase family 2 [Clostridium botulinum]MBY6791554.1 glycosyltransferase family 2 protein [Clostridium botulinum]MBY6936788.1 glycosyltransferase family 2 protein [Clostridium botulinum]
MKDFIFDLTLIFQIFVFVITLYYLILSLFGIYKKRDNGAENCTPKKKFALVVAAHNEEMVIGKIIESLEALDYPKNLYDIFIIADNCTDNTAKIAKTYDGVYVCERNVPDKRGKGYALEWMFSKLFNMDKDYDAIAIFDADNLVSKNFLKEMNYKMLKGYKVVQGYIDSKNPNDSWITGSYSIAFWTANRLFQLARANLGLSNQIGGTGFCMDSETLKELGWGATCLTEDLEFTCKLVLNGHKVGWAHNARVYDEKPLTLKQSWNQRKRWMQGFADVSSRFFTKLIKKAFKERSFVTLDCALYTVQPFVTLLLALSAILTLIQNNSSRGANIFVISYLFSPWVWKTFSIIQFLFTPLIMLLEKKLSKGMFLTFSAYSLNVFLFALILGNKPKLYEVAVLSIIYLGAFILLLYVVDRKKSLKMFIWYLLYGIYTLTWIPITIQGILNKNNKEWSHTKHIREMSIQEMD